MSARTCTSSHQGFSEPRMHAIGLQWTPVQVQGLAKLPKGREQLVGAAHACMILLSRSV